jgi:polyphosphate kinase
VLTPLSVDPSHPVPYISNLSLNLAVVARDPDTQVHRFARIKVPPLFARWIPLPGGAGFVPVEQLIAAHAQQLFPGWRSCRAIRSA